MMLTRIIAPLVVSMFCCLLRSSIFNTFMDWKLSRYSCIFSLVLCLVPVLIFLLMVIVLLLLIFCGHSFLVLKRACSDYIDHLRLWWHSLL